MFAKWTSLVVGQDMRRMGKERGVEGGGTKERGSEVATFLVCHACSVCRRGWLLPFVCRSGPSLRPSFPFRFRSFGPLALPEPQLPPWDRALLQIGFASTFDRYLALFFPSFPSSSIFLHIAIPFLQVARPPHIASLSPNITFLRTVPGKTALWPPTRLLACSKCLVSSWLSSVPVSFNLRALLAYDACPWSFAHCRSPTPPWTAAFLLAQLPRHPIK